MRTLVMASALSLLTISAPGQSGASVALKSDAPKKTAYEEFKETLGKFWSAMTKTTAGMKGGRDKLVCGQVFTTDLDGRDRTAVSTSGDAYCSPVFEAGGQSLLAVRDGSLYRLRPRTQPELLWEHQSPNDSIWRLIGVNMSGSDDNQVLALIGKQDADWPQIGILTLRSGNKVTLKPIAYPQNYDPDLVLTRLLRWDCNFGDVKIDVLKPNDSTVWNTQVTRDGKAENISKCEKTNCAQPALSLEKRRIAFVMEDKAG